MGWYLFSQTKEEQKKFKLSNWNFGKSVCDSFEVGTLVNFARPACAPK